MAKLLVDAALHLRGLECAREGLHIIDVDDLLDFIRTRVEIGAVSATVLCDVMYEIKARFPEILCYDPPAAYSAALRTLHSTMLWKQTPPA